MKETAKTETMTNEERLNQEAIQIAAEIRAKYENPNMKLERLYPAGHKDRVFICRKSPWSEYKKLIGSANDDAEGTEALIQKFLMHPKPEYEAMQNDEDLWSPGLMMELAKGIQKALGFSQGEVSIKKL